MKIRIGAALLIGLALTGTASALFTTEPAADDGDKMILPAPPPAPRSPPATAQRQALPPAGAAVQAAPQRAGVRRGNPLWGMPLRQFTAAVERPLFAPTRRPPPPPAAAANRVAPPPPPRPEPEKPALSLVGTVAVGSSGGIGLFIDQGAKSLVRLKMGEVHQGWTLRAVQRREVVLEKAREKVVLTLPPPDTKAGPPGVAAPLVAAQPPASPPPVPPVAAAPPPPGSGSQAGPSGNQQAASQPGSGGATPFAGMLQMLMNQRPQ
jgi:hypothetical protein